MGGTLTRNSTGLVDADDFDRADNDDPGGDWTEVAGDVDIASNELTMTGGSGGSVGARNDAGSTADEWFAQVEAKWSSDTVPAVIGVEQSFGSTGYAFLIDDNGGRLRIFRVGVGLVQQNSGRTFSTSTFYAAQVYSADDVQEMWAEDDSSSSTVTATDNVNNGVAKRLFLIRGGGTTQTAGFENFLAMTSKYITVDGLSAGYKAKVLDGGDSVIAEATAAGGTATIDCSVVGGATEAVPFAGWASIIVTNAGDAEQARYDSAGVYPGDDYSFTASLVAALQGSFFTVEAVA